MEGAPSCWPRGRRRQPPADAAESGGLCLEGQRAARRTARPQPASLLSNRHYPLGKAKALPLAKAAPSSPLRTLGVDSHRPTWWVGDPPPHSLRPPCPSLLVGSTVISATGQGPCVETAPASADPAPAPVPAACPQPRYYPADSVSYRSAGSPRGPLWPRASGVSGMRGSPTEAGSDPGGRTLGGVARSARTGSTVPLGARLPWAAPTAAPASQVSSRPSSSDRLTGTASRLTGSLSCCRIKPHRKPHQGGEKLMLREGGGAEVNAGPARHPHLGCRLLQGRPPKDLPSTGPLLPPHLTTFPSPSTALLPGARPPLTRLLSLPVLDLPHTQELPGFAANRLHARVKKPDCPGLPLRVLRVTTGRSALGARLAPRFLCSHSPHSPATHPPRSDCPIFSEREGDVSGKKKDVSDEGHTQTH